MYKNIIVYIGVFSLLAGCSDLPTCGSYGVGPNDACTYSFEDAFSSFNNTPMYNTHNNIPMTQSPQLLPQRSIYNNSTDTYMLNTPNGMRRCTVTSSGFVNCY